MSLFSKEYVRQINNTFLQGKLDTDQCHFSPRNRRGFEGVFMGVCSSVDVTQSEGDLPDFNQSEH